MIQRSRLSVCVSVFCSVWEDVDMLQLPTKKQDNSLFLSLITCFYHHTFKSSLIPSLTPHRCQLFMLLKAVANKSKKKKKLTMKRRWVRAEGGEFIPPCMGRVLPWRKRAPLEGRGRKEGRIRAECHPCHPRTWKKHLVSSGFKATAITSDTQGDRTSLLCQWQS